MPLTPGSYAYRVRIDPVSSGTQESDSTLSYNSSTHLVAGLGPTNARRNLVLAGLSDNQFQGLLKYLALIKANVDTASIETAIDAAL